ncbi:DUF4438 domain-containing protein [Vitiosangium sp. GDMCC 1.1324]|uniref:DUF4438 domain-containing protein n=1 Tax=Vitiosangium sp. (strain GDMCC 1.1324) TaxID=2138576 RepID=UPI000D350ABC|nr:DUF4438 domain-containing protein [Vitiosangium sp. GDMCC 1.1324]PTL81221.1 DUF4438 domain-containing protein [Vitiosangium sp. GDMCC 1.1324]
MDIAQFPVIEPGTRARGEPRTNVDRLVAVAVAGQVAHPIVRATPYRIGRDGVLRLVPGSGGIVLNRRVGDRAVGLAGDHVEAGVSLHNNGREVVGPRDGPNRALMFYSCVGNRARVMSGAAAGAVGSVVGKHGGINHVIVDFAPDVKQRLGIGDRIQIDGYGQGLSLPDYPDVRALNLSPRLLRRWGVSAEGRRLHIPITHIVPSQLMGSGLGRSEGVLGDLDIQLSDAGLVRRFRLGSLRLGDLVAICPLDYSFGPTRRPDAVTVGVVVHTDSQVAGHGPGVTPLLMGPRSRFHLVREPGANLARVLGLRRDLPH